MGTDPPRSSWFIAVEHTCETPARPCSTTIRNTALWCPAAAAAFERNAQRQVLIQICFTETQRRRTNSANSAAGAPLPSALL